MSKITLITDIRTEDKFIFDMEKLAQSVLEKALEQEGCPLDAEVSLLITEGEEIRSLNREYRGIDSETDVLSFPGVDFDEPGNFSLVLKQPMAYVDPDTDSLFLGDIVINTQRVRSQSQEYGHSEKREFAFLVAHSALHLCGYDHIDPQEASVMEERQEKILRELGIGRI